jgi:hypothetical protein
MKSQWWRLELFHESSQPEFLRFGEGQVDPGAGKGQVVASLASWATCLNFQPSPEATLNHPHFLKSNFSLDGFRQK